MRNVTRVQEPRSLCRSSSRWTKQLLEATTKQRKDKTPVPKSLKNKFRKDDVRTALQDMYKGLCCYCEARIGIVSFAHIEHRMPISRFPGHAFSWDNLHLACEHCNISKSDKWDEDNPILDAVNDTIEDHLTYMEGATGVRRWPKTQSADTTIRHADLDRRELRQERSKLYLDLMKTIREIIRSRKDSEKPKVKAIVRELRTKCDGEFGSLIAWVLREFLEDAP